MMHLIVSCIALAAQSNEPGARAEQPLPADGFPAVVIARQAADVGAPRDGLLQSVDVTLGQRVAAGAVLASLETETLRLELASAEVALREAQGERGKAEVFLAKAEDMCARIAARPEAFAASEHKDAEFDRRVAQEELAIAGIRIERRGLELQRLRELLTRSQIVAPFDGTVALLYAEAGSTIAFGAPIVRLITPEDLLVRFAAPADAAPVISAGRTVRLATAPGGPEWTAVVEHISPEVDPALQMLIFEARLETGQNAFPARPGLGGYVLP